MIPQATIYKTSSVRFKCVGSDDNQAAIILSLSSRWIIHGIALQNSSSRSRAKSRGFYESRSLYERVTWAAGEIKTSVLNVYVLLVDVRRGVKRES